jgi:hypothetical protein
VSHERIPFLVVYAGTTTMTKAPQGLFRGDYDTPIDNMRYAATGEFRPPRKGEFYMCDAVAHAFLCSEDFDDSRKYWIVGPVVTVPGLPHEFINLLIAVTSQCGIKGNPYVDADVKAALKALARLRGGREDYLNATSGLTYTGDKPISE